MDNKKMKKTTKNIGLPVMSALLALSVAGCDMNGTKDTSVSPPKANVVHLDQGWNKDEALDFYNTSQGSHLVPYAWFLALEQHGSSTLFRDDKNMQRLGYIPQPQIPGRNVDGLPIGFVKDDQLDAILSSSMAHTRLSSKRSDMNEWLGLTCAACHTANIQHNGQTLRIDGGQPLSDMQSFLLDMSKALTATGEDDAKLTRFAKSVLAEQGFNEIEKQALKKRLISYIDWLEGYIKVNYGGLTTPYGYGRLDAFGAILNQVSSSLLDNPDNGRPANAPVSYPFLWNTSQLEWVQWNGSVDNHIGRNIGEVTGVFAHTILKSDDPKELYYSSGNLINLDRLEQLMSKLDSPKWGAPLPAIDQNKANKGKALFANNCVSCHGIRDENEQFPMTPPNSFNNQFIKIHMTPLQEIGTDPLMASNFGNEAFNADPGPMRETIIGVFVQGLKDAEAFKLAHAKTEAEKAQIKAYFAQQTKATMARLSLQKVQRGSILTAAGAMIIQRKVVQFGLDKNQVNELQGNIDPKNAPNLAAYKARPLNGIWATAPYMHNGSMSNLYQTLLPEAQREKSFDVGSNEFDSVNVGYKQNQSGNNFRFETLDKAGHPIPGNSNAGHSGDTFTKTLDNGKWRNFTDAERYQLIEYMKTL
jgi:mono/diheme cytochrome c family protein